MESRFPNPNLPHLARRDITRDGKEPAHEGIRIVQRADACVHGGEDILREIEGIFCGKPRRTKKPRTAG
jgi:hypothetical protein